MTSREEWLQAGITNGWCGPVVCEVHGGPPTTKAEDDEFEASGDPCLDIVRIYKNPQQKADVEANHSPSVWRNLEGHR